MQLKKGISCLCLFILILLSALCDCAVEQVHLSVTGHQTEMAVDFVSTNNSCNVLYTKVGDTEHPVQTPSTVGWYHDEIGFLHHATMSNLEQATHYNYTIVCHGEEPRSFVFQNAPQRREGLKVAFIADFGLENDVSMRSLLNASLHNEFDMLLLGGDFAYDLMANHSQTGNIFMNMLEPLTSKIPFMPAPGNHEKKDNFTQYYRRFEGVARNAGKRSQTNSCFFYSWDTNNVHFVAIDTEIYAYFEQTQASPHPFTADEQLAWLDEDLARAHSNRENVPWIVMFGHKGWYMDFEPDKSHGLRPKLQANFTRFTELSHKYKVDLFLGGHVHIYQRFFPLLGPKTCEPFQGPRDVDKDCIENNGTLYRNPKYMTSIIVGSPGDPEITFSGICFGTAAMEPHIIGTIANCAPNYGYGIMTFTNSSHMQWEWMEVAPGNFSIDTRRRDDHLLLIREH